MKRLILCLLLLLASCSTYYRGDTKLTVLSSAYGLTGSHTEYVVTIDDLDKHNVVTNTWIIMLYDRYQDQD